MKGVILLLLGVSFIHADPRGKPYEREKVCQEFKILGKDQFYISAVIMNSRKYSNATFEETTHLVKAVMSLVEKCCVPGAAADCYDKGASELSLKSCEPKSPFPRHPGIANCCLRTGLERKLCLADLKQPPKEFPTYVEESNDELCDAFRKDPKLFSTRFMYEYSSNYAHAPLLVVINSTTNYLSMATSCCTSKKPSTCFLKQRLQRQPIHLLTVMSNRLCSHYSYGEEKLKLSAAIMFSQRVPSAEYRDIMSIVQQGTQVLAKCCSSLTDNCMENELSVHIKQVCKKLSSKDSRVSDCCKKSSIDTLYCLHSMPAAEPISLPKLNWPGSDQLCKKGKNQEVDKYTFELTRRNTKLPEVFVDKLHGSIADIVKGCCESANPGTCLDTKKSAHCVRRLHRYAELVLRILAGKRGRDQHVVQREVVKKLQLSDEINKYISEGKELCSDYNSYPFSTFKERLIKSLSRKVPKLPQSKLDELVVQRADLASTCCITNAPPVYCKEKINEVIGKLCNQDQCLLQ